MKYHGNVQPIRFLYAAISGYGARETATIVMSRWFRWTVMPLKLSIHQEHTKHGRVEGPGRLRPGRFWIEHRVIDHELVASIKHVVQGDLPALALEGVVLVHQLPGKLAALATQLIAQVRELLFFRQVLLARRDPLVVGHHLVSYHPTFILTVPRGIELQPSVAG